MRNPRYRTLISLLLAVWMLSTATGSSYAASEPSLPPAATTVEASAIATAEADSITLYAFHDAWDGNFANYARHSIRVGFYRVEASAATVSVDYSTSDGTAAAGVDYEGVSGTVTFGPHESEKIIEIPVHNLNPGQYDAGYKTATITISNAAGGASLGWLTEAELRIYDPDSYLKFTNNGTTVQEGYRMIEIPATYYRIGHFSAQIRVVGGTAVEGTDFAIYDPFLSMGRLDDDYDEIEYSFPRLEIWDDGDAEGDETVELEWVTNSPGVIIEQPNRFTVTIADDEIVAPAVLAFGQAAFETTEHGTSLSIPVYRTSGHTGPVTVQYATENGSAVAGADYSEAAGTLTFAAGQTSRMITIALLDDALPEFAETFKVHLSQPSGAGGAELGPIATASVLVLDNDLPGEPEPPGQLRFSANPVIVNEGARSASVTIERTGSSQGLIAVDYRTADGTAEEGKDYTRAQGTIVMAAGETTKTIVIPITDDKRREQDETFRLELTAVYGEAVLPAAAAADITIQDNDRRR